MARTPACRRWRSWWRPSSGPGCGESVGLLLATPLTVCVLVVGKHVPQLSFLDILLGDEPVFEPKKRVYQRLLAGDQEEAAELFDEYFEHTAARRTLRHSADPGIGFGRNTLASGRA